MSCDPQSKPRAWGRRGSSPPGGTFRHSPGSAPCSASQGSCALPSATWTRPSPAPARVDAHTCQLSLHCMHLVLACYNRARVVQSKHATCTRTHVIFLGPAKPPLLLNKTGVHYNTSGSPQLRPMLQKALSVCDVLAAQTHGYNSARASRHHAP